MPAALRLAADIYDAHRRFTPRCASLISLLSLSFSSLSMLTSRFRTRNARTLLEIRFSFYYFLDCRHACRRAYVF